jgi:flagellar hook-associated protein 1 FlgK
MSASIRSTVLSGIQTLNADSNVAATNLKNIDNPDYIRRDLEPFTVWDTNVPRGLAKPVVQRKIDRLLQERQWQALSFAKQDEITSYYLNQAQLLFEGPEQAGSLNTRLNEYFSAVEALSNQPMVEALRTNVIQLGGALTDKISSTAQSLYDLQFNIERAIPDKVNLYNQLVRTISGINQAFTSSSDGSILTSELADQRDGAIRQLSEIIAIKPYLTDRGAVVINSISGMRLLGQDSYTLMEYNPAGSPDHFAQKKSVPTLSLIQYDQTGQTIINRDVLVSQEDKHSPIINILPPGELAGMIRVRDQDLPKTLEQLDNFAYNFAYQSNKVHHRGSGYPPLTELLSQRLLAQDERREWTGTIRIGAVDDKGRPWEYAPGERLPPLELALNKLDDGYGPGIVSMETIRKEINVYFNDFVSGPRVTLGSLTDIKMASMSNTLTANGSFTFDMELLNPSEYDVAFEVLGVTVTDVGCTGLVGVVPGSFTVPAMKRQRTNLPITVDFSGGAGGPYTVQVAVRSRHSDGSTYTSTIDYVVDDTPAVAVIKNQRYAPVLISQGPDGELVQPSSNLEVLMAEWVDHDGIPVASGAPGYLRLQARQDSKVRLVTDDLTSQDLGLSSSGFPVKKATGKGLAHFLQWNTMFAENDTPQHSAASLAMDARFSGNPSALGLGTIGLVPKEVIKKTVGESTASGKLSFVGVPSNGDTLTIAGKVFTFRTVAPNPDDILIGVNLADTLANAAARLNTENAITRGTVDLATYGVDNGSTLTITYDSPGTIGHKFQLGVSLASTTVAYNKEPPSNGFTVRFLEGGTDKVVTEYYQPYAYEIARGSTEVIYAMAQMASGTYNFPAAGGLTQTASSFVSYISRITSFQSNRLAIQETEAVRSAKLYEEYTKRVREQGGIDLDEIMMQVLQTANIYGYLATILQITTELEKNLLAALGR